MQTKKWYRSKTIWSNFIGIIAIIISSLAANKEITRELMPAEGIILAVINLGLRLITRQGLES